MKRMVICMVSIFFLASVSLAQLPTATVLGEVKDSSGAVVAGAHLTARNTDTGQIREAVTGDDGAYRLDALPVGNYEVTAEKAGFKAEVQSGLTLTVTQQAVMNFTMQVGEVSQRVSVAAEAPVVNTTTSSLGGLVDEKRITDLPLNGRNYIDLTLLQPGIAQNVDNGGVAAQQGYAGTIYSANGAPIRSNAYLLDGALLQSLFAVTGASAVGTTLGVDGILEYRVITNNFSAEYGGSMGSMQVIVSKGGTNRFRGDAFEYLRNSVLDARNFFDLSPSQIGHRLPEFRRNNFGGAFGGPIRKDKTFFYAVYEGLSQALGTTNTATVFSAGCHGAANAVITVAACPEIAPNATVTIAPQIIPALGLFPLPNLTANTYGFGFTQPTHEHYGQLRLDQNFSNSDAFFARYTVDESTQTSTLNFPAYQQGQYSLNQFVTLSENHIFSTSLLNTARVSFSRTWLEQPIVASSGVTWVPGLPQGSLTIQGITPAANGGTSPSRYVQNIFTWSDDLSYTRGRHSLKFGFIVNQFQWNMYVLAALRGNVTFANTTQFLTANLGGGGSYSVDAPGSNVARDFHFDTMGFYAQDDWRVTPRLTLNIGLRYEPSTSYQEVHGIQAALLNYATDATTTLGQMFRNPTLRNWSPRVGFAWDIFGNGRTALRGGFAELYDLSAMGAWANRMISYDPPFDQQAVVTTGLFAIPYVLPSNVGVTQTFHGPIYQQNQPHLLSYNLTLEHQLPGSIGLTVAFAGSRGIDLYQTGELDPKTPNGIPSGGICVAPPAGTAVNLTSQFEGNATSCYLPTAVRINPNWNGLAADFSSGNSNYNALEVMVNKRLGKGLEFQSSYTYSKSLDNETSMSIIDGQAGATNTTVLDPYPGHAGYAYGPADGNLTHNWRLNAIYRLPDFSSSNGFLSKVENGWWTSGILAIQSGYPMNAFIAANRSQDGNEVGSSPSFLEVASLMPGRTPYNITHGVSAGCGTGLTRAQGGPAIAAGTPLGTPSLWYDPCAFYVPPQGFLGTEPRNFLTGPGLTNLNFSIVKDTAVRSLGEAGEVEFRAEFFNLFNHPNFSFPNKAGNTIFAGTCPGAGNAALAACTTAVVNPLPAGGTITSTATTSRQIQFGLKLIF